MKESSDLGIIRRLEKRLGITLRQFADIKRVGGGQNGYCLDAKD